MNLLFLKIVNMSIVASWLVLAVLVLRLILREAPKWVNVLLWGIVALRLILPFSVKSNFSLIPSTETLPEKIISGPSFDVQTGIAPVDSVVNNYLGDRYFEGVTVPTNNGADTMTVLAVIWIVGMVLLAAHALISYRRLHRQVGTAVRLRENIYQSENISSPFVLGIIRPRIYLPFAICERDITHVVAHEEAHICRRDHWWKPLGFLLLTLHWFNPLMWISFALLCRDIELACDEKVIRELDNEQRADYSQALVSCSISRPKITACPLAFGEISVKDRVKSVMDYRRPKFWIVLISAALCIAAAACFLTDPKEPDLFHGGLNAEIIEIDQINHIMYVKDVNENADVFGERCALDCSQAASRFKLLYANYDSFGDVRDIEFTDFQVGDSVIVTLADSEFKIALNNTAVAEQVQLGTQRLNNESEVLAAKAYTDFLAGDRDVLSKTDAQKWWIPDFQDNAMQYQYLCLDIDQDTVPELLVQMTDDPGGYNGAFDYRDGQIFCLNSDSTEISCFDYPLSDGTMVRQYFYSGITIYTSFRYKTNGEIVEISRLFDRGDDPGYHAGKPSPQYEIDGKEVNEKEFNQKLEALIKSKLINEQFWKDV